MARHNREAHGEDQHGHEYTVTFQPDWLHQVKVTRDLETGRQSTKTLVRNSDPSVREPGHRVRTMISAPELGLDLELALEDPRLAVRRITIEATVPEGDERGETVMLSISRKQSLPHPDSTS